MTKRQNNICTGFVKLFCRLGFVRLLVPSVAGLPDCSCDLRCAAAGLAVSSHSAAVITRTKDLFYIFIA